MSARRPSTQLLLAALLLPLSIGAANLVSSRPAASPAPAPLGGADARALSEAFRGVSERAGAGVVSVRANALVERRGQTFPRKLQQGSGVLLDDAGLIVTNFHVVDGADELLVLLADGRDFEAELHGVDPDTDLAVVRIEADGLQPVPLSTREPEIGEWVLAMGNPFGIGHTVTAGIVSGKGRNDLDLATYEDFLQTDAAINPGNSGGPLVDLRGEVVGINTAIGTASDGSQGIGFAIPSYMVRRVVDDLVATGRVSRGYLGVNMSQWPGRRLTTLGFDGESRVLVDHVIADTPAAAAGLAVDDVILSVAGRTVADRRELMTRVADLAPGTEVELRVWRGGDVRSVWIVLGERPPAD